MAEIPSILSVPVPPVPSWWGTLKCCTVLFVHCHHMPPLVHHHHHIIALSSPRIRLFFRSFLLQGTWWTEQWWLLKKICLYLDLSTNQNIYWPRLIVLQWLMYHKRCLIYNRSQYSVPVCQLIFRMFSIETEIIPFWTRKLEQFLLQEQTLPRRKWGVPWRRST